jgi:hypothetical protein
MVDVIQQLVRNRMLSLTVIEAAIRPDGIIPWASFNH